MPPACLPADALTPMPVSISNVYVLPLASGVALIDCGPPFEGAWEQLVDGLRARGHAPADVAWVLLTHSHLDHSGLAHRLRQHGARIAVHAAEAQRLARVGHSLYHQHALNLLLAEGAPEDVGERALGALSFGKARTAARSGMETLSAFDPDLVLRHEQDLGIMGAPLRALHTPGHSPGSTCFYAEGGTALFSGDALFPTMAHSPPMEFSESGERLRTMSAMLRSLDTLDGLGGRLLLPGHGPAGAGVPQAVERTLRHHERRAERLLAVLGSEWLSAYALVRRLYPHLQPGSLWPAMSDVLGHLDLLDDRRLISARRQGAATVYGRV